MFFTLEKLEARTEGVEKFRYFGLETVLPMESMDGGLPPDEVYADVPDKVYGSELNAGDVCQSRDKYRWARKTLTLPESRSGCMVAGLFDFGETHGGFTRGVESLLYVNGEPWQGVDVFHSDVILQDFAGREVTLTFLLWGGLEGIDPQADIRSSVRRADIGYLHVPSDEFYHYSKTICKTLRLLKDTQAEKHELSAALENAYRLINWDKDKFHGTVGTALASLTGALARMDKRSLVTVNVTGHTHIDVAWLWRLKHTREKAIRSFSTVLRLMEEFDDYTFLQTQPQLYKYIKNDAPALYGKIKARVAEGRWETDGGMWVEADCNIPSGESLVRQFTHGIRFFKEEFGVDCEYLWLPDVFGYSWSLPQILKQCNIKTFMTTKLAWNQYNSIPCDLFRWRGIDGSEILTYFITTPEDPGDPDSQKNTYNDNLTPQSVWANWYRFKEKHLTSETLTCFGYGDGGGGPNRDMLKMRRVMDMLPGLPNVKPASVREFFSRLNERIDAEGRYVHTWDGELYFEYHRGTYTSQAYVKKMNRRLEFALGKCEWLSCLSRLNGGAYPAGELHNAWETVLLHQFHDIIPGSSIGDVYADTKKDYEKVEAVTEDIAAEAVSKLTNAAPDGSCFILCNPGSFGRSDMAVIPVAEPGTFYDGLGAAMPAQMTAGGWLVSARLPAFGMMDVSFVSGAIHLQDAGFAADMNNGSLESGFYIISWNKDGHLTRLFDKENGREVIPAGMLGNVLEIYEDRPLHHDNWDIDLFYLEKRETAALTGEPELMECGPLRCVVRFSYRYNDSAFTQDMIVYKDSRRIEFRCNADWREDSRLLKAAFQVGVRSTKASYDIQYGHVERPTHWNTSWDWARFEVVGHKWADLSETGYGVALLNDCKYGYSIKDNEIRLTLLKSSKLPDPGCDMGEHEFAYALLPHAGGAADGGVIEESVVLNQPLDVFRGKAAGGIGRLVILDSEDIIVDAVKKADREDCIVVRMHECRGGRAIARLSSDYPLKAYAQCNLLEESMSPAVSCECIDVSLNPFELRTYKLWFN